MRLTLGCALRADPGRAGRYPVGVPAAMLGMLYYYQVPKMASQKTKAAGLKALLASFRQVGCPFCTSHLDACNCGDMPRIQHSILPPCPWSHFFCCGLHAETCHAFDQTRSCLSGHATHPLPSAPCTRSAGKMWRRGRKKASLDANSSGQIHKPKPQI